MKCLAGCWFNASGFNWTVEKAGVPIGVQASSAFFADDSWGGGKDETES